MKAKPQKSKPTDQAANRERQTFSFADSDDESLQEKTWFRRAVDAGLRYKEDFSERSGIRVVPEISILEPGDLANAGTTDNPSAADADMPLSLPPAPARSREAPRSPPDLPFPVAPARAPPQAPERRSEFAPEKMIGETAINDFVQGDELRHRQVGQRRQANGRQGTVKFYQQPARSGGKLWKIAIALVLIAGGAAAMTQVRHSRLAAVLNALKANKAGKRLPPPVETDPGEAP